MYDRFSDGARKAMQAANLEAMRFQHKYIGTEHILLGIVQHDSGIGAVVLKSLGVDLRRTRAEVEILSPSAVEAPSIAPVVRAKKVIEYSIKEANDLRHSYIGTGHLLLGLLREREGMAAQTLMRLGLDLDAVREEVLKALKDDNCSEISDSPIVAEIPGTIPSAAGDNPLVVQLVRTLDEFSRQKEWCVAKQQFEEAAVLRDQCDIVRGSLRQIVDLLKRNPNLGKTQEGDPPP
jgi:ATP-dependent Clp protease ATP-binding subunit ClpC